MSLVLDAGGATTLARRDRSTAARIERLRQRSLWPPVVPTIVLVESLTGRGPRDATSNRLLRLSTIHGLDESLARRAAELRTRAQTGSAADAVVVATAELLQTCLMTSDIDDIGPLAANAKGVAVLRG
ncbi:MAG: hypothetical protein ACRD0Q_09440 [Acidimicrobiales bacterium]